MNFWESNAWSLLIVIAVLFLGIAIAYTLKNCIKPLRVSLVPVSVLAGLIILVFTTIYKAITKENFFDLNFLSIASENTNILSGSDFLEAVTYHCLGIGFVAMAFRRTKKESGKSSLRSRDALNTGITTVSTYLLQALVGLVVTVTLFLTVKKLGDAGLIPASGILLCLGFGQGTGQALNFGTQYETMYGFTGGAHFGLSIAALGFLAASLGGVIYLNILRKKGKITEKIKVEEVKLEDFTEKEEIGLTESVDKLSIQIGFVIIAYILAFLLMKGLSLLIPSMSATIFGFNFLFGTLMGVLFKVILNLLHKKGIVKRQFLNNFLMNRICGVAFDIMIVSGIAVIDLELIKEYWFILLLLALVGAAATFFYIRFICKKLFKDYKYEQFFGMYGMLTGTASTGIILLREIDPNLTSPTSSNLVYQNFPAIVLGLPIMLLVPYAAKGLKECLIVFGITLAYFIVLVIVLFRSQIFKKKAKEEVAETKE